jgi:uncharacterized protein (DUF58 family)
MRLNIFNRRQQKEKTSPPLFDEAFLRRLERLNFRTVPSLRGSITGERRSRNLRPALDFSDHRSYSPGDDLRHVDWNAYARHEELFVKLGEATQSVNIHILLDTSRSMMWEPNRKLIDPSPGKWAGARRLAGALSYLSLSGGERLVLTPFAAEPGESFGPTHGQRRVIPALQFLSTLTPAPAPNKTVGPALARSLMAYARTHSGGGLLILVSDLLDAAASVEAGKGAKLLAEGLNHLTPPRWQVIVMHVLSEEEMHPTLEGDFDLQDMETGETLPFHLDQYTLSQYRLRMRRWCSELQQACARRGAIYARIMAEWPFERAVIPYLRQRGVVQ